MSDSISQLNDLYAWLNSAISSLRKSVEIIDQIRTPALKPVGSSPVDPKSFGDWGAGWFDASPFGKKYGALNHYHTGADLNRANYEDSGRPVYAAMDGLIIFTGAVSGWQQQMTIIRQADGACARYAHITADPHWLVGMAVERGEQIGTIADYGNDGKPNDHLHFDICKKDLTNIPGDWPGMDYDRLVRDYLNPLDWLKSCAPDILAPTSS